MIARDRVIGGSGAHFLEQMNVGSTFLPGDRVLISTDFYWAKGAYGTIARPPSEVTALSGPWDYDLTRKEISALGEATVYWVWFDDPQFDADGCGPYRGGSIDENALTLIPKDGRA